MRDKPGKPSRIGRGIGNALVSLGAICLALVLFEVIGHALLRPSAFGYGRLLGRELPPFRVVPACDKPPPPTDSAAPYRGLVVDGQRITVGDLYGIYREDPELGYAPKERAVSANGWWQSDNLGARDRHDVAALPDPGSKRLLVFGESFGAGSRVRQEQVWSAVMAGGLPDMEVLNFSVDGYSMAQAYLRFREVRAKIKYDAAIMMFVPHVDPPRDINVYRPLLSRDWPLYTVLPRFTVEHGRLALAPRPVVTEAAFLAANCRGIGDGLRAHLARYDRFFVGAEYRPGPPLLGRSLFYKLGVTAYANALRRRLADGMMRPDSEALRVTSAIFLAMNQDVRQDGGRFVVAFLPLESELKRLGSDTDYRKRWRVMVAAMCRQGLACIDLAGYLPTLPKRDIDRGYDGTHYGPVTNRRIGEFIARQLTARNFLSAAQAGARYGRRAAGVDGMGPQDAR